MTHSYLALLRGINVGGNAVIKMADLKQALEEAGFGNVRTYIQSGNALFTSDSSDKKKQAADLHSVVQAKFALNISVALFTSAEWRAVIESAPKWWGVQPDWKHNLLAITEPISAQEMLAKMGELKPDIDLFAAGDGVIYQSVLFEAFGRSTTGKLAANPIYKQMTIRNYNTATKLAALLV